jgi:hypothetical protein
MPTQRPTAAVSPDPSEPPVVSSLELVAHCSRNVRVPATPRQMIASMTLDARIGILYR